jgi:hypothetical protein
MNSSPSLSAKSISICTIISASRVFRLNAQQVVRNSDAPIIVSISSIPAKRSLIKVPTTEGIQMSILVSVNQWKIDDRPDFIVVSNTSDVRR